MTQKQTASLIFQPAIIFSFKQKQTTQSKEGNKSVGREVTSIRWTVPHEQTKITVCSYCAAKRANSSDAIPHSAKKYSNLVKQI